MHNTSPSQLTDAELVDAVVVLAGDERRVTVALVAHLAELEARGLYLAAGFPSMFTYCVQVLRLSEGGAYNRIEAARTARAFPVVLDLLERGQLNLASLRLLAPHLTSENHERLLARAGGKSKREVAAMLAAAFPKPDVAPSIRRIPDRSAAQDLAASLALPEPGVEVTPASDAAAAEHPIQPPIGAQSADEPAVHLEVTTSRGAAPRLAAPSPPRHPLMTPLSADRYQIRFTGSGTLCEKLKRAQDLLRHAVPDGDPGEIFERALTALLADLHRGKFAATERPRGARGHATASGEAAPGSRAIPAAVRRSVTARDEGRCAFVSGQGNRCGTRAFLEFHHVVPYARGGPATLENIQLRCRAHNAYEATLDFGTGKSLGRGATMSARLSTRPGTSWASAEAPPPWKENEAT
jgi:hypothetical protein